MFMSTVSHHHQRDILVMRHQNEALIHTHLISNNPNTAGQSKGKLTKKIGFNHFCIYDYIVDDFTMYVDMVFFKIHRVENGCGLYVCCVLLPTGGFLFPFKRK